MSEVSPIEQAINQQVAKNMAIFQDQFVRRNGGVPANPTGKRYMEAIAKLNTMISQESSPVTPQMAQNTADLLAVLNAQHHPDQVSLEHTLGLLSTLVLPKQEDESKDESKAD